MSCEARASAGNWEWINSANELSEEEKTKVAELAGLYLDALDYKSFLTFPDSKLPHDLKHDKDAKQKWSNRKCDSLTNYELVKGAVYRKPMGKYIERYNICFIL